MWTRGSFHVTVYIEGSPEGRLRWIKTLEKWLKGGPELEPVSKAACGCVIKDFS